jgi:ANTAR domain
MQMKQSSLPCPQCGAPATITRYARRTVERDQGEGYAFEFECRTGCRSPDQHGLLRSWTNIRGSTERIPQIAPVPTVPGTWASSLPNADEQLITELRDELAAANKRIDGLQMGLISSRVIGAALGIIMVETKTTIEAAFELLSHASMHQNMKLRDVADLIVTTGDLPSVGIDVRGPGAENHRG